MTQGLKTLAVLLEDPGSIPSTHIKALLPSSALESTTHTSIHAGNPNTCVSKNKWMIRKRKTSEVSSRVHQRNSSSCIITLVGISLHRATSSSNRVHVQMNILCVLQAAENVHIVINKWLLAFTVKVTEFEADKPGFRKMLEPIIAPISWDFSHHLGAHSESLEGGGLLGRAHDLLQWILFLFRLLISTFDCFFSDWSP